MSIYGCNMNLELQQRAVEYHSILRKYENLRDGLFEQMPPLEMRTSADTIDSNQNGYDTEATNGLIDDIEEQKREAAKTLFDIFGEETASTATTSPVPPKPQSDSLNILDFIMDDGASKPAPTAPVTSNIIDPFMSLENTNITPLPTTTPAAQNNQDIFDIFSSSSDSSRIPATTVTQKTTELNGLDDIFGLSSSSQQPPSVPTTTNSGQNDIMNLFGTPASPQIPSTNGASNKPLVLYEKNELRVVLEQAADGKHSSQDQHFIQMKATNLSVNNFIKDFLFSAAAPKTMQLQLSQSTTSIIQPMDSLSQIIAIANPKKERLRLRIKISYKIGDLAYEDQSDVSNFPEYFYNN